MAADNLDAVCRWLTGMSEGEAVRQVVLLVRQAHMMERCSALDSLMSCRSWSAAGRERLRQFRSRECNGTRAPALTADLKSVVTQLALPTHVTPTPASTPGTPAKPGCACTSKPQTTTNGSSMHPNPAYSPCGQFHGPADTQTYIDLEALTNCEAAACAVGTSRGLKRVPFSLTVAPGASVNVSVGFGRAAHLVALTFQLAPLDYDIRNWRISGFETSNLTQAWELYRNGTTFARDATPSYDANLDNFPAYWWLEDGEDSFSALMHRMNLLPDIVPPENIGDGTTTANYTLSLDSGAAASETIKGMHWVYFKAGKKV